MTHRTMIVARMADADADAVAKIFAESDAGPLPHRIGVTGRSLFSFHGLYFHLIESGQPIGPALSQVREDPEFTGINARLAAHISPFDPETWRSPADAMAHLFYRWQASH